MNKIIGTITVVLATIVISLNGAVGCMDNSQHLRHKFDTKAYHYVACDCVCRSKAPGTNRCARCGHIMVPQEQEYVANMHVNAQGKKESTMASLLQNPALKLEDLIRKYRLHKANR